MRNHALARLFLGFPPFWQGILMAALGNAIFAHMDVFVKLAGPDGAGMGTLQVIFGRCLFALPPVLLLYWLTPADQRGIKRPGLHALRLLLGLAAMGSTFTAYMVMPIAEAYALLFACPLLVAVLAVPVLGEAIHWPRLACVLVGFAGVLLIVAARLGVPSLGTWLCVVSVISNAGIVLTVRVMARSESTATILLTFTLGMLAAVCALLFAVPMLLAAGVDWSFLPQQQWKSPDLVGWLLLIAIGLTGGVALMLLIPSYRRLSASISASFDYSEMLYAVFWGWMIWQTVPGPVVMAGCALVMGAGLAMVKVGQGRPAA